MKLFRGTALASAAGITHAFFTREGGKSKGIYSSLNCGLATHDVPETILANRGLAMTALNLNPTHLCLGEQVHGDSVAILSDTPKNLPEADGLVTCEPGLGLGILTADCAPILIADGCERIVGAAHCGWRGTLEGIIEATLDAMCQLGARREQLVAAIGPSIGPRSYQVGQEFRQKFVEKNGNSSIYFSEGPSGKMVFNLPGYIKLKLEQSGVKKIDYDALDTYTEEQCFFSYRRSVHRGESDYGRQLSVIALEK